MVSFKSKSRGPALKPRRSAWERCHRVLQRRRCRGPRRAPAVSLLNSSRISLLVLVMKSQANC